MCFFQEMHDAKQWPLLEKEKQIKNHPSPLSSELVNYFLFTDGSLELKKSN